MLKESIFNIIFFVFEADSLTLKTANNTAIEVLGLKTGFPLPDLQDILHITEKDFDAIKRPFQDNFIFTSKIACGAYSDNSITLSISKPSDSSLFYATGILEDDYTKNNIDYEKYINHLNKTGMYSNIFYNSNIGIAIVSPDTTIFDMNPYIKNLFKLDNTDNFGKSFGDIFLCKHTVESNEPCGVADACRHCIIQNGIIDVLTLGITVNQVELCYEFILNSRLDMRWFSITISPIQHNGERYAFVTLIDTTFRKQLESRLMRFGITDELTGLYNRRFIIKELHKLAESEESKNLPSSVVMIDIDNFKKVNDTYGHLTGDTVLKTLADIIETFTRHYDFAGRYGGEEFLLILPRTVLNNAERVVRRIADKFRAVKFDDIELPLTFSAGIIEAIPCNHNPKAIFHKADELMYAAKAKGKDCIEGSCFTELG